MKEKKSGNIEFKHEPVLLKECVEGLKIQSQGVYVDGTLGGGGHSKEILKRLSEEGIIIGIDKDTDAISAAKLKLKDFKNAIYINNNHDNIKQILSDLQLNKVDGILLDLGVSTYQLDEYTKGFSYMKKGPLDMRMDKEQLLTAKEVVNKYSEDVLIRILYEYGEEKYAKHIAKEICKYRKNREIEDTEELVSIIQNALNRFKSYIQGHPAKRTFQAIRIEVNNELEPLYNTVIDCINSLKNGGRLCIITFHSLEDRIVKNAYNDSLGKCTCPKDLPYCVCNKKGLGNLVNKKAIVPSNEEINLNPKSKSAKLRIFEKCEYNY